MKPSIGLALILAGAIVIGAGLLSESVLIASGRGGKETLGMAGMVIGGLVSLLGILVAMRPEK